MLSKQASVDTRISRRRSYSNVTAAPDDIIW